MTIVEFLQARLAEREARHRPIADGTGGWAWFEGSESESARVLREVEALRTVLECVLAYEDDLDVEYGTNATPPERITSVRALAAIWCDHPDYDESWLPA